MRGLFISAIAIGALGLACSSAFATKVSISGTHSWGDIRSECYKAGGVFQSNSSGYLCSTQCGTSNCSVSCNKRGKCTGTVPHGVRPSHTFGGILHPPSSALKASRAATPSRRGYAPVKIGGLKPSSAGLEHPGGGRSPQQSVLRATEHSAGRRH